MFYASYGSFVHSLIERYYSEELTASQLPSAFLLGFQSNVLGERPAQTTVTKFIQAGLQYFQAFQPFPFEKVAVEEKLTYDLDGLPFTAVVDYVGLRDGKLAVIDNKSRELKPRSKRKKPTAKDIELEEMLRQLYLYAKGIQQKYGELPSSLCFNCYRNGQFIEEPFDQKAYIKTIDWAKRTAEELSNTEDFRPDMDYFKCRYLCGFHDQCIYYQSR